MKNLVVYQLLYTPPHRKLFDTKCDFKTQRNEMGEIIKCKAGYW